MSKLNMWMVHFRMKKAKVLNFIPRWILWIKSGNVRVHQLWYHFEIIADKNISKKFEMGDYFDSDFAKYQIELLNTFGLGNEVFQSLADAAKSQVTGYAKKRNLSESDKIIFEYGFLYRLIKAAKKNIK